MTMFDQDDDTTIHVNLRRSSDGINAITEASNFCSWRRLMLLFKGIGEIQKGEEVVSLVVTNEGITYTVCKK